MPKNYADPARRAWPFFALFILVGLGFLTPFVLQGIRDYRIARVYLPTEAEIMSQRLVTSESSSKLGGRWVTSQSSHTEFTWSYVVNKRHYIAEGYDNHDGIMADPNETGNLSKGVKHECWYDPDAPEKSVLVRSFRAKFYLGALIPGSFIFLGLVFMRGVLRRKPMPTPAYVSEGERLKCRLAPVLSTRGVIGCLGTLVIAIGLFIALVIPKFNTGGSTSLLGGKGWLFLISLAIEGFLIYQIWTKGRAALVPDPIVEISDEPLHSGQTSQLFIRQTGPAELASFQVHVICETIGQNGSRTAYKHLLINRETLHIPVAEEFTASFALPENAKPSVKTVQTATTWNVRIRRQLSSGARYDTDYPFRVVNQQPAVSS